MTESQNIYDFRAEIKKLLDILSKSLYKHKEIFIRELISNSVDALKKIQFILLTDRDVEAPDAELKIEIFFNSEENTLTIRDTGVGMAKEELINDLGTIAGSGTEKFITQLQEMKKEGKKEVDLDIIGQFGIGFYSVFMVADKVKVITKSYKKDEPSYQWESDGSGKFTIEPADKKLRGTDVVLYLTDEEKEFLNQYRIETIIKKYSNFVSFPIYVSKLEKGQVPLPEEEKAKEEKEEKEKKEEEIKKEGEEEEVEQEEIEEEKKPVNETEPLWRKKDQDITEEQYKNFYNYIAQRYDDYLHVINYQVEGTSIRFRSLMYIPESSSRDLFLPDTDYGLSLYSRNVMIMKYCKELIPNWMRFVKGVLESDDISLNISRETIQSNVKILKMKDLLAKKFIRELTSVKDDDSEKYRKFWDEFGDFVKEGIISDQIRQKKLQNLLLFSTSKTKNDELIGLKDYLDRIKEDQEEIYYLVGESLDLLRMSPHLGYYEKNDIEVILFDKDIDNFLMMHMNDYTVTEGEGDDKEVK
ncbi:MAG: molecular chaperone HtpG, partial [Candidatus Lokiarchaeota archaeon]|nr:molecular chaperone HtpG [Candidatus Lokiarchaeota archaeon]MBD3341970.1 molecular chaperone HtpG [Candidatus Lokiarchaeota archaeon]